MTSVDPVMVLISDDEAIGREIARRMVERLGHRTIVLGSGAEVPSVLDTRPVDVLLINLQMIDGFETVRRVLARGERHRPRVVAMTANPPEEGESVLLARVDGHVHKPLHLEELGAVLAPPKVAPPVDPEVIANIREAWTDGEEALVALVDGFFSDIDRQLPQLSAALAAGELEQARRLAHAMKGSTGSIGASRLSQRFRAVELALRGGDSALANQLLPELAGERARARAAFDVELRRTRS